MEVRTPLILVCAHDVPKTWARINNGTWFCIRLEACQMRHTLLHCICILCDSTFSKTVQQATYNCRGSLCVFHSHISPYLLSWAPRLAFIRRLVLTILPPLPTGNPSVQKRQFFPPCWLRVGCICEGDWAYMQQMAWKAMGWAVLLLPCTLPTHFKGLWKSNRTIHPPHGMWSCFWVSLKTC